MTWVWKTGAETRSNGTDAMAWDFGIAAEVIEAKAGAVPMGMA